MIMIVRHYKGGEYEVLIDGTYVLPDNYVMHPDTTFLMAVHTEKQCMVHCYRMKVNDEVIYRTAKESFVVYRDKEGVIWARPAEMFWEWGYFNNQDVYEPRFSIIEGHGFKE